MKTPKLIEHEEQKKLIRWAKNMESEIVELISLYAIPNAGKRSFAAAKYYKDEGLRTGFPDLCLPVGSWGYHALYIEMKVKPNTVKPAQKEWAERLKSMGNMVVVCWSVEEAIEAILHYLDIKIINGKVTTR